MTNRAVLILWLASACAQGSEEASTPIESHTAAAAADLTFVHVDIPPLSIEGAAEVATEVIHAIVTSERPVCADGDAIAFTELSLDVRDTFKGAATVERVVRVAGADACTTVVSGSPRFVVGDEVVLFLWRGPDGGYGILGLGQGTYRVRVDRSGRVLVEGPDASEGLLLSELAERVRAANPLL